MYYRFFKATASSPLVKALTELAQANRAALPVLKEFVASIGATNMYGVSPANYRFDFHPAPDPQVWAKTKPRRGTYYFVPRKNTPEGKAMRERINALPAYRQANDTLSTVPGLDFNFPVIIQGSTGYMPHIRYYTPKLAIVQLPWRDIDKAELEAYSAQRNSPDQSEWSAMKDYLLWTPPKWLRELKEWEALKVIEDGR